MKLNVVETDKKRKQTQQILVPTLPGLKKLQKEDRRDGAQ